MQLSPVTADVDEAKEWLEAFKASGFEGLVVKGASSRYLPGQCEWLKVHRDAVEAIIGAVTGSLQHPEILVVGRYRGKELEMIGPTVKLETDQQQDPDQSRCSRSSSSRSPPTLLCKSATTATRCAWSATAPTSGQRRRDAAWQLITAPGNVVAMCRGSPVETISVAKRRRKSCGVKWIAGRRRAARRPAATSSSSRLTTAAEITPCWARSGVRKGAGTAHSHLLVWIAAVAADITLASEPGHDEGSGSSRCGRCCGLRH